MSRFKALRQPDSRTKSSPVPSGPTPAEPTASTKAKAREGKKAVVGYYSADMSRQIRVMAIEEGVTMQALIGEAIDLLMRNRGKHPFGER
jgi:hypothetical protein